MMRYHDLLRLSRRDGVRVLLFALPIFIVTLAASAFAQTSAAPTPPAPPPASAQPPSAKDLENWRTGMAKVPPPTTGCFTLSYPNTQWQQVPCVAPPRNPFLLAHGPRASTVGNGNDVAVGVTSGHISLAVGSFDSVSGVTSVSSGYGSNDYSLQLNTNTFSSLACSGAANPSVCVGWVQFLYSQGQCSGPCAFLEYSLINWGSSNCPSGWSSYNNGVWVCYFNTNAVAPSTTPTISNLGNLVLMAEAQSGGNDTVIFSSGSALYLFAYSDSELGLASGWTGLEYNIVGDCCGSGATFNSGAAMTVRASVENGSTSAPSCVSSSFSGYTGETNNLNLASAPAAIRGTTPAMMFSQSSSGSASSPCSAATAVAGGWLVDSHDFNADGKSDIVWRDTSGDTAIWEMNGTTILNLSSSYVATVSPSTWSIVGVGDFYGTGKSDILWRDTSGDIAIWEMNGTTITNLSSSYVATVSPSTWSIVGVGDFYGIGKSGILWRDTSGDIAIWEMNGTTITNLSSSYVATVSPSTWTIQQTGDYYGIGKSGILWRDTSGDVAAWEMNGTAISNLSSSYVATVSPSTWTIQSLNSQW